MTHSLIRQSAHLIRRIWGLLGVLLLAAAASGQAASTPWRVYIGTYTGGDSQGIYLLEMDSDTGTMRDLGLAAKSVQPSFLALHPSGHFLYAVNETESFQNEKAGSISAFAIESDGRLRFLNQVSSGGAGPCHLIVDAAAQHVLAANYGGGSVTVRALAPDGKLGNQTASDQHAGSSVNRRRQEGPHAHCIHLDAANDFAYSADLGTDQVMIYRYDARAGTLTPQEPPSLRLTPGSGPRHFAFHPSAGFAYVINELSSTVTACALDAAHGRLEGQQTISSLPEGFQGDNSTADIHVHPNGRFLYGSNRGHDSIVVFAIDATTGLLRTVQHQSTLGKTPRNFAIDPEGKFLVAANQGSGTVVVFRVDPASGRLEPTGAQARVPSPVCVQFLRP